MKVLHQRWFHEKIVKLGYGTCWKLIRRTKIVMYAFEDFITTQCIEVFAAKSGSSFAKKYLIILFFFYQSSRLKIFRDYRSLKARNISRDRIAFQFNCSPSKMWRALRNFSCNFLFRPTNLTRCNLYKFEIRSF